MQDLEKPPGSGTVDFQKLADALDKVGYIGDVTISDRAERRLRRNLSAAHFPLEITIDSFEFNRVNGIDERTLINLLDFRWIDNEENLFFLGPPGLGKSHLSIALGFQPYPCSGAARRWSTHVELSPRSTGC